MSLDAPLVESTKQKPDQTTASTELNSNLSAFQTNSNDANNQKNQSRPRYFGIDLIRVLACYMVMQTHSGEYYYIGENTTVKEGTGPFWVGIYNSLFRSCVPLFVMISGYLLLPVKTDIPTFLKTRLTRVLYPFVFWCIVYAFYFYGRGRMDLKETFLSIPKILVNFGTDVGHLWYIYMLLAIYLFAPILSPWIKQATIGQFLYYITFWVISGFIPYIHLYFPRIWGEAAWNNTPSLYPFTGHVGYAVLGAFMKLHLNKYDLYWLGAILVVVGYAATTVIYEYQYYVHVESAFDLEISWNFNTINVALMTCGLFLLLRKIQCHNNIIVTIFQDIALKSYGMYLAHILVLDGFQLLLDPDLKRPLIFIPLIAICTFIATYIGIKIISFIPYSKYIIG